MTVARRLSELVTPLFGGELPVAIRGWDGSITGPTDGPILVVNSRAALRRLMWNPSELGFAQAYITGELDVEGDMAEGFRRVWQHARAHGLDQITLTNREKGRALLTAARLGVIGRRPPVPESQATLGGALHSKGRDRAAIAHHYDLSNEFYSLILDENMAYSCAYYAEPGQPIAEAQTAKLDLICRKLGLEPGMRLLDIGCGWGSLILHAATHYGVRAVGVTLSNQQREFVTKAVADRGLSDRVEVRLQDYRDVNDPPFDAVSSIEMGEHVGQEQYPVYAATMFRELRPGGRLLLQQMSRRADSAPGGGAFIENYIAPDMHMRPLPETMAFVVGAGFEIRDVEALREHYAWTVQAWIDTFESHFAEAVAMVGEEVARVWRLYLVGGALSFEEGRMGVDQILAVKPSVDGVSSMPPRRPWAL
ncbi:MAG: hypothetical protein JWM76_416 [Pseudonocardiales bacterium]|nr:hypothetical protein [Pseudonocardiales bacterium]